MITAADVRGALRLLRERGWLTALFAVVVLSVAFVQLGEWQHHRYASKVERNRWIDTNYGADPVPLAEVLPSPTTTLTPDRHWTPVRMTGVYEPAAQLLVRNRPLGNDAGFEVVVPLRVADGSVVLIDRGWLPAGENGGLPDAVPAPPVGTVEVVARLRASEPSLQREAPPGQVWRIDTTSIATHLSGQVYLPYGVLASESPAATVAPTLLPWPDEDLGPHLGYAWQWWLFTVAGYGILAYYMLREARLRTGNAEPISFRVPAVLAARTRKGRGELSDEDWEDALPR